MHGARAEFDVQVPVLARAGHGVVEAHAAHPLWKQEMSLVPGVLNSLRGRQVLPLLRIRRAAREKLFVSSATIMMIVFMITRGQIVEVISLKIIDVNNY